MLRFLIVLFLCSGSILAFSQNDFCGTSLYHLDTELRQSIQDQYNTSTLAIRSGVIDSIAVTVHIIQSENGLPIRYPAIQRGIEKANKAFLGSGLAFFICGSPRVIPDLGEYTYNRAEALNKANYVPNTLNLYYVDSILPPNGNPLCGLAKYPFTTAVEDRYVMLAKECATNGSTLIHELGHYFGLFHTHETFFGQELVNQSNCEQAGDLLCDTPADPNLLNPNYVDLCNYIGQVIDFNGQLYRPEVKNYMSYSPAFCQSEFSRGQLDIIRIIRQNENGFLAGSCEIKEDIRIEGEVPQVKISTFDQIQARYKINTTNLLAPSEVIFRIILKDQGNDKQQFTLFEQILPLQRGTQELVFNLNLSIPGLPVSGIYNLEAEIDADYALLEKTEANNISRTKITINNTQLSNLVIFPNPTRDETFLFFRNDQNRGEYQITVFDYKGSLMLQLDGQKYRSEVLHRLDVSRFPAGIYTAHIEFKKTGLRRSYRFIKNN